MGYLLVPAFMNIIMIELGKIIVKYLVDKSLIKVYMLYADQTLLLVTEKYIKLTHEHLDHLINNGITNR